MKWFNDLVVISVLQDCAKYDLQVEKPVSKTCKPETQSQSGSYRFTGFTGKKRQVIKTVCKYVQSGACLCGSCVHFQLCAGLRDSLLGICKKYHVIVGVMDECKEIERIINFHD